MAKTLDELIAEQNQLQDQYAKTKDSGWDRFRKVAGSVLAGTGRPTGHLLGGALAGARSPRDMLAEQLDAVNGQIKTLLGNEAAKSALEQQSLANERGRIGNTSDVLALQSVIGGLVGNQPGQEVMRGAGLKPLVTPQTVPAMTTGHFSVDPTAYSNGVGFNETTTPAQQVDRMLTIPRPPAKPQYFHDASGAITRVDPGTDKVTTLREPTSKTVPGPTGQAYTYDLYKKALAGDADARAFFESGLADRGTGNGGGLDVEAMMRQINGGTGAAGGSGAAKWPWKSAADPKPAAGTKEAPAAASGGKTEAQLRAEANDAIKRGADPAKVKARFKELTKGKDL